MLMNLLIGVTPAIIWGVMPIFLDKVGGNPFEQIVGTTLGTFIFSLIISLVTHPQITEYSMLFGFLSGFFWSIGQIGQYSGYVTIGTSKVFPLSSSLQIVGNSLIGGFIFGEWKDSNSILKGMLSIFIIVMGVIVGNVTRSKKEDIGEDQISLVKPYLILIFTTIGYWLYSAFPKMSNSTAMQLLLPQSIGMSISALFVYGYIKKGHIFREKKPALLNIFPGLFFGIAAFVYLISINKNGMVRAFVLSQMNVVIATLIGIFYFHDKAKLPRWRTFLGLFLIIGGAILLNV